MSATTERTKRELMSGAKSSATRIHDHIKQVQSLSMDELEGWYGGDSRAASEHTGSV